MSPDRSPPVALEIVRDSPSWDALPNAEAVIEAAVAAVFAEGGMKASPEAELAVTLADDARVKKLNAEWRAKDAPTNVLTFPAVEPDATAEAPMLGDVILAFETVDREAREEGKALADHVAHLTIHGVLHLFGHDHLDDAQADAMEAIEIRALARLGIADPYACPAADAAG